MPPTAMMLPLCLQREARRRALGSGGRAAYELGAEGDAAAHQRPTPYRAQTKRCRLSSISYMPDLTAFYQGRAA